MIKFVNVEMDAANISLRLVGGKTTYKVKGFTLLSDDKQAIELYRASDLAVVMRVPLENIDLLEAEL
jgi:hypothetical protein